MKSWVDFWNSDHAIYVSDRHKEKHAAMVGRAISSQIPSPKAVVLDYGCGEALYAAEVAKCCGRLLLCEAAEAMRVKLEQRVKSIPAIAVMEPSDVAQIPDHSVDLVIANSLAQYLTRAQFLSLLMLWRQKLAGDGVVIIADVVPPHVNPLTDAVALLSFGWQGGFFPAAFLGLARTALSGYGRVRKELGFSTYDEAGFIEILAEAGFKGRRLYPNFGHNQARIAFRATAS